ncbi:MAG: hypothetical protein KJ072_13370 [Verrucomicrobia bacterium]|nr:hypothetical protein [Verrucomicrobiota bacterium]
MSSAERWLSLALRILAVPVLLAIPCALLPMDRMDAIHQGLGLGPLPAAPILEYLARSSSLLYGFHGFILLLVASDVRRYLPVIWLLGGAGFAFGLAMLVIDHVAGLPVYWRWLEGGFILGESGIILVLTWRVDQAIRRSAGVPAQGSNS